MSEQTSSTSRNPPNNNNNEGVVLATSSVSFLPDFTEHPKPKRRKSAISSDAVGDDKQQRDQQLSDLVETGGEDSSQQEVTFTQDFIAGGLAGSASVVVGHPLDTIKVRIQNSTAASSSILSTIKEFGGVSSLFRGMAAPLSAAAAINAIVFSCYGAASKFYDSYIVDPSTYPVELNHDPWWKSLPCGSFAGLVQCTVICPMELVKCRIQVQTGGKGAPLQATRDIIRKHGITRLYQGWWITCFREVPAFGLYFSVYDYTKDRVNTFFLSRQQAGGSTTDATSSTAGPNASSLYSPVYSPMPHTHTWAASALAGGIAGSMTWLVAYPFDVIKTKIQTSPLDTPRSQLTVWKVGSSIVAQHGWRHLFRGLGITLIRAFPVNGTIFPVYELTLLQLNKYNI